MIKTSFVAASLLGLGLAFAPAVSSAAVIQTADALLSVCPALSTGTECAEGAADYLAAANPSNRQIVRLVTSIADAAESPRIPMRICLDAAQGIRILAGGVSNGDQRQQILLVADDLCRGAQTAAIFLPWWINNGSGNNGNGGLPGGNGNSGGVNGGGGGDDGGGDVTICAGNSHPGNGNNCNNTNRSHSH